ncbi:MAG TPA: 2-oxo acid dehydrogenase subunit E2 [Candidatus Sulfomarinibacteraceae bacterium]|nr:2-oxo acid dehydrogenase subunit E2 [Candidatus Sulfomarinibacteraceae bacterium]
MSEKVGPYRVVDLPPGRRVWLNVLDLPGPKHCMYGLLEVDVTVARQFIAAHKARCGETLSFTGYLVFCLARAVDEDRAVQAYLVGHKKLVLFDDVNVGLMVESKMGEKRALMGHVIRRANHKTYREIHDEIRSVQSQPAPPNRGMPAWFRSAMLLPWPLHRLFSALLVWATRRDPTVLTSMGGTVGVTAVGMFGEGHSGWGIFPVSQALGLVVGSIARKPAVVEGQIVPREILHLTVMFDHDIVDGAPAARFTRRLLELIESGYGLQEPDQPDALQADGRESEPREGQTMHQERYVRQQTSRG